MESTLLDICPNIYGPGSFPFLIIFVIEALFLLAAVYEAYSTIVMGKWRANFTRYILILSIVLFLSVKTFFYVMPIGWNFFNGLFICDQIPRFILFGAWEFLSIWLGNTFINTKKDKQWISVLFQGTYAILLTLALVFSSVTSVIRHYMDDGSMSLRWLTTISNCSMFFIVSISLFINFYRLIKVYFDANLNATLKNRLCILVYLVGIVFSTNLFRFAYSLLKLFNMNAIYNYAESARYECVQNDIENKVECLKFSAVNAILVFIFDVVPIGFLLLTFSILKAQSQNKRPKKHRSQDQTSTISDHEEHHTPVPDESSSLMPSTHPSLPPDQKSVRKKRARKPPARRLMPYYSILEGTDIDNTV
ncbi:hypothetical protein BLNAU_15936 [Blattamonas nauphoetae]|uniref:Transmembrane protein n=1 Tax=Blattamonas nauphoetae TaxID=2049346 RepID=A0ABQ9XCY0_9EUKA|nr:hypothetical protein BLNAU_15936 [Blattamonas nauphoetae]